MRSWKKIDWERLRHEIRTMNPRKTVFKVLKEELTKLGYWKNLRRGRYVERYVNKEDQ